MQSEKSRAGNNQDQMSRQAFDGGNFSYNMATNNATGLSLMIRYWGAEWGDNKFDIYIDDQKLITEDNTGRWNQSQFKEIIYTIPDEMVKGKDHIRVKFQSFEGTNVGPVYYVRLIRTEQP
jgi:uncharacterized protein